MIKRFKSDIFQDNKYLIVTILIICTIFFYLEFKIWYGEFSKSKLMVMQKEIKNLEMENEELSLLNHNLAQDKERLSAGKEAIEGIARTQLGLIKPNEVFYKFENKKPESTD